MKNLPVVLFDMSIRNLKNTYEFRKKTLLFIVQELRFWTENLVDCKEVSIFAAIIP